MSKQKDQKFIHKVRDKYRLVILNANTHEEKFAWKLSMMNLFVFASVTFILMVILITSVIIFTPLKIYIPGYADIGMRQDLTNLILKTDSLQKSITKKDLYIANIKNVLEGNLTTEDDVEKESMVNVDKDLTEYKLSKADSALRAEIEDAESNYDLYFRDKTDTKDNIASFTFFTPLKGILTEKFDASAKHYAVDVVAQKNEAIKATLDGTVILATWTSETGYVIGIQHTHNLLSFYKHNSVLLKKVGNFVKAGDVIAIIGDSGELSSGQHLHFELWYNGKPINPEDYMVF
ncbi:MAG: M23 family metallopeptidase [Bacteroidia bacterium]|nr:M23 family metallopeptidase [Bacteroidia bacterium]